MAMAAPPAVFHVWLARVSQFCGTDDTGTGRVMVAVAVILRSVAFAWLEAAP